jgi:non-specific protein-tyrosine kinase
VIDHASDAAPLSHLLRVLRRGTWIIALVTCVTTATAVFFSLRQSELYKASAEVYLKSQTLAALLANVTPANEDPQRVADTQARLARVPKVAQLALERAGARDRDPNDLLANSSVSAAPDADFLNFSVTDSDPEMAVSLATAYAYAYTRYRRNIDAASLKQSRHELENEMRALQERGQQSSRLYAALAERDQELRTNELLQTSNASVARPADRAQQIQPRPLRDGILAGIFGLGFGIALAFLGDALNTRVRTAEEIQERLGLPLLAHVYEPVGRLRDGQLTMLATPYAPDAEAFRILATNLDFISLGHPTSKILITSAMRSEGKSATTANLAVAFARAGRRIAVVDLDLRSPSIDRLFGLPPDEPGVTSVALGRTTLEHALVRIPILDRDQEIPDADVNGRGRGVLEVLPSGPLPPNPADFVASADALNDMLAQLAMRAQLVLIDSPPILEVSDAMALSGRVDGILVVSRLGQTQRPVLNELRRVLDSAPARKLGFVATGGRPAELFRYGYAPPYGQPEELLESRERQRLR